MKHFFSSKIKRNHFPIHLSVSPPQIQTFLREGSLPPTSRPWHPRLLLISVNQMHFPISPSKWWQSTVATPSQIVNTLDSPSQQVAAYLYGVPSAQRSWFESQVWHSSVTFNSPPATGSAEAFSTVGFWSLTLIIMIVACFLTDLAYQEPEPYR